MTREQLIRGAWGAKRTTGTSLAGEETCQPLNPRYPSGATTDSAKASKQAPLELIHECA